MIPIKKTLFTLNVDNYAPEITELTYPFLKKYAQKIGADFYIISERKYPDMPPVYEKLQIYDLAQKMQNDWNIFVDSDALIHPETIDFTQHLAKDTVMHHGSDMAAIRWKYDEYFLRDGRNIGSCNWFTIASDWCVDLWQPLDISLEQAVQNINPTVEELHTVIEAKHLIDDYTLSRNIAKYGLKFTTVIDQLTKLGLSQSNFFYHIYTVPKEEKVTKIKEMIDQWRLNS